MLVENQKFNNRVNETNQILSYINAKQRGNLILVLTGRTGVGKSGLVRMILGTALSNRLSIQVNINKSSPDTIENLHYHMLIHIRLL